MEESFEGFDSIDGKWRLDCVEANFNSDSCRPRRRRNLLRICFDERELESILALKSSWRRCKDSSKDLIAFCLSEHSWEKASSSSPRASQTFLISWSTSISVHRFAEQTSLRSRHKSDWQLSGQNVLFCESTGNKFKQSQKTESETKSDPRCSEIERRSGTLYLIDIALSPYEVILVAPIVIDAGFNVRH